MPSTCLVCSVPGVTFRLCRSPSLSARLVPCTRCLCQGRCLPLPASDRATATATPGRGESYTQRSEHSYDVDDRSTLLTRPQLLSSSDARCERNCGVLINGCGPSPHPRLSLPFQVLGSISDGPCVECQSGMADGRGVKVEELGVALGACASTWRAASSAAAGRDSLLDCEMVKRWQPAR